MPGVSWRAQTGNTSEFALDLALVDDPDEVGFLDDDVLASWGTLSIWAAGVNLCAVRGRGWAEEGTHWYLLGLAEWFIEVWAPLLHEERLPLVNSGEDAAEGAVRGARAAEMAALVNNDYEPAERYQDWRHRHSVRSAEPEALLPDLYLRRYGDNLELSVGSAPLPGADTGATFPRVDTVRVPVVTAAMVIHGSLTALVTELLKRLPDSKRLQEVQRGLADIVSPDPGDRAELGWLSGLGDRHADFAAVWARTEEALTASERERAQDLSAGHRPAGMPSLALSTPLSLLYGSLAPEVDADAVIEICRALLTAPRNPTTHSELVEMSARLRSISPFEPSETPGEQGSILGDAFYAMYMGAGGDERPAVDIEALLAALGIWVREIEIGDTTTRAVSILAADDTVGILVNSSYRGAGTSAVRRFTLAHELAHLVLDQAYARQLIVASGPWAPVEIEKRANAFAAALLMPATVVGRARVALPHGIEDRRGLSALARVLDVSFSALVGRLQNLGLLSFEDAERLRDEQAP